jgi:hypothetical protein
MPSDTHRRISLDTQADRKLPKHYQEGRLAGRIQFSERFLKQSKPTKSKLPYMLKTYIDWLS